MDKPIEQYSQIRLAELKKALVENNFEVFLADDAKEAKKVALGTIIPEIKPESVSWGGSMTFTASGLYDALKKYNEVKVIDTYDKSIPHEEMLELRRQALLTDLFITGTNAVTESGQLVNLDMFGNRVAALTFGPKFVIVMLGRNKIVKDIQAAMDRIKKYTAPVNAMRLDKKTPCTETSYCDECKSPGRICNTWTITEKSFPKGRVKVILINENLGL